ncbi:hypothetical protein WS87_00890 (plasmid) [Burkholderia sp. MSMB0856]|nr:hypothetical protein WS87_00890 [Burkholderia sp. MSMB0856]
MITQLQLEGTLITSLLEHIHHGHVAELIPKDVQLAINLSARALLDSTLPEQLMRALGMQSPRSVTIEITESDVVLDREFDRFVECVTHLKAYGLNISVDDFGQGYSSLVRLARLHVNEMKLDRALTVQARTCVDARKIIQACAALANNLGIHSVLEGIETAEDMAFARTCGVDAVQGFFICPPLPAGQFAHWISHVNQAYGITTVSGMFGA